MSYRSLLNSHASPLAVVAFAAAGATFAPGLARAACTPAAANNATVTCTGTNLPAFIAGGFTGVTVNVNSGAPRDIYSGENIDSMNIDNFGTISVTRNGNATSTQAVADIDSDDDT